MSGAAQHLTISAGGDRLEARRWPGARDAVPVMLLHEGLGSVGLWRDFPQRLAAATGREVVAWSRAGYGRSAPCALPRPIDYMEREALLLPQVLRALDIPRACLLGHSDGGSIAALAGHLPEVAGLILIAPHFFVEECSVAAIAEARRAYDDGDLRARLSRHHDHVDAAFRGWNDAWLDPAFRDWNIAPCLNRLHVPVLALQGTDDPYGTRAQVDFVASQVAGAQFALIEGCGHAPHLDAADDVLRRVAAFLAGIAP